MYVSFRIQFVRDDTENVPQIILNSYVDMCWVYCRTQFKAKSCADNKELLDSIKFLHISWPPDLLLAASEDLRSVDIVK
jgi:hypothetical protein